MQNPFSKEKCYPRCDSKLFFLFEFWIAFFNKIKHILHEDCYRISSLVQWQRAEGNTNYLLPHCKPFPAFSLLSIYTAWYYPHLRNLWALPNHFTFLSLLTFFTSTLSSQSEISFFPSPLTAPVLQMALSHLFHGIYIWKLSSTFWKLRKGPGVLVESYKPELSCHGKIKLPFSSTLSGTKWIILYQLYGLQPWKTEFIWSLCKLNECHSRWKVSCDRSFKFNLCSSNCLLSST